MRLVRPRFTTRGLMLAVAFAATFLAGWVFGQRRERYSFMAAQHAAAESYYRSLAARSPGTYEARIAHRARLRRKWEQAAWFPFWPVKPDPGDPP